MAKKGGGGPSNQVGEAFITVGVDNTPLDAGLKAAEVKTQQSAQKMDATLGGVGRLGIGRGGVLDNVGASIKNATSGLRGAVGAVTAVIGTFSRMLGIIGLVTSGVYLLTQAIGAVRGGMAGGADEAERMKKNVENAEAASQRLKDLAKEAADELGKPGVNPDILDADKRNKLDKDILAQTSQVRAKEEGVRQAERQRDAARNRDDLEAAAAGLRQRELELQDAINKLIELEKKRARDDTVRNRVFKDIIEAATNKIIAIQKEQTNKLLESIAFDSARSRQIAEEMQANQHRGP